MTALIICIYQIRINRTKLNINIYWVVIASAFAFFPPSTMTSTCSFCPKVFSSELELSKHVSTCSVKDTCSIALPSGSVTAYRNSNNQWPCYCDLPKCKNKIFPTDRALQRHITCDAKPDTQWKVCCFQLM